MMLATLHQQADNPGVAVNPATGIGVPNTQADSRPLRHFLCPSLHALRVSFMAGECGASFGMAGSCVPVRQLYISPATLIGVGVGGFIRSHRRHAHV